MKSAQPTGEHALGMRPHDTCIILAEGRKPGSRQDLRSLAYVLITTLAVALPEPMFSSQASSRAEIEPPWVMASTIFLWGLADYPEENLLYRFKTDFEETLVLYNKAMRYADYGVLGVATKSSQYFLAGYNQLSSVQVQMETAKARSLTSPTISFAVLQRIIERVIDIPLEDFGALLLRLAEAHGEGRFEEEYGRIVQGPLRKFHDFLLKSPGYFPAPLSIHVYMLSPEEKELRAKFFIKALALEYRRIMQEQVARALELQAVPPLLVAALKWLVKLILETVAGFSLEQGLEVVFGREPIPDILHLEIIDEKLYRVIAAFNQEAFTAHLNRHEIHGGKLFGLFKQDYLSYTAGLLRDPEKAYAAILAVLLDYVESVYMDIDEFKARMEITLETVIYLASIKTQRHLLTTKLGMKLPGYWSPKGAYLVPEDREVTIVLTRPRSFENVKVVDVATMRISLCTQPSLNSQRYIDWFEEATQLLSEVEAEAQKPEEATPDVHGVRVAAIVFREQVDPASVRALADALYSKCTRCATDAKGYMIWRETDKVFFSHIHPQGVDETVTDDAKIVRSLVPDWAHLPVEEYQPRPSNPEGSNTGKPVSQGSGSGNHGQPLPPTASSPYPIVLVAGDFGEFGTSIYMAWKLPLP